VKPRALDLFCGAADGHEVVRRSKQGSATDAGNILGVCRPCHIWINSHPKKAHALGLHVWSWEADAEKRRSEAT
jgi:hypothetical protein